MRFENCSHRATKIEIVVHRPYSDQKRKRAKKKKAENYEKLKYNPRSKKKNELNSEVSYLHRCKEKRNRMTIHNLIAHYLKSNNYHATLQKFEEETGTPIPCSEQDLPYNETLQEIINDRITFSQLNNDFDNKLTFHSDEINKLIETQIINWSLPYPKFSHVINSIDSLVISSELHNNYLYLGTTDTSLIIIDLDSDEIVFCIKGFLGRVVIKKILSIEDKVLLVGMDGKLHVYKTDEENKLIKLADLQTHTKLVTDVKHVKHQGDHYLVSLGWDLQLKVSKIVGGSHNLTLELVTNYTVSTQGSCIDATSYNDSLTIIVGQNEYTLLEVLQLNDNKIELRYKISLNDAEFLSSVFSPRCVRIFNNDNVPLIAVGTSHEPYMRVIVVPLTKTDNKDIENQPVEIKRNQILKNLNTMSPQDKYSTALIEWRKDGSGVWVVGEDGNLRGFDLEKEDEIVSVQAHDGRIKSFAIGEDDEGKEMLVSCGTDRSVKYWTCQ